MATYTSERGHGPRIVSLLPSASEMICLLGAHHLLVGRSHECDWPPSILELPALTGAHNTFMSSRQMHDAVCTTLQQGKGLYTINGDLLRQLRPNVIVTQSLCSVCAVDLDLVQQVAETIDPRPRVVCLNPQNLADVLRDMCALGEAVGLADSARAAAARLQQRIDAARAMGMALASARQQPLKAILLEWTDPLFPGGHWTPQLIAMAGGVCPINPARGVDQGAPPSRVVPPEDVVAADPDLIIVAPCGLNLEVTRREVQLLHQQPWWQGLRAVREGRVVLVDGNQQFNRPGPRLVEALEWLVSTLHQRPDLSPPGFPWEPLVQRPYVLDWTISPSAAAGGAKRSSGIGAEAVAASAAVQTGGVELATGNGGDAAGSSADGGACAGGGAGSCSGPWVVPPGSMGCATCLPAGWAADIEELHAVACRNGESTYVDPPSGYTVFTEDCLWKRGTCCGNRCRHCPWAHANVSGAMPRTNRLVRPALLLPTDRAARRRWRLATTSASARGASAFGVGVGSVSAVPARVRRLSGGGGSGAGSGSEPGSDVESGSPGGVVLLFLEGQQQQQRDGTAAPGIDVDALVRRAKATWGVQEHQLVAVAAHDVGCGALWGSLCSGSNVAGASGGGGYQGGDLWPAIDACFARGLPLVAVPLQVKGQAWVSDPGQQLGAVRHALAVAAALLDAPLLGVVAADTVAAAGSCSEGPARWQAATSTPAAAAKAGARQALGTSWQQLVRQVQQQRATPLA